MKKIIVILIATTLTIACQSQVLTVTNGDKVLTFSNWIITTAPLAAESLPALVGTNGVVAPAALLVYINAETGIPLEILKSINVKYLVWFGILLILYNSSQTIARDLRKAIPDSLQTGKFGLLLANVAREVNPSIAKLNVAAIAPLAPIPTAPIPEIQTNIRPQEGPQPKV
jgi:hypothetical protein